MPDWAIALSPFGFLYRDSVGWASEYGIGNTARLFQVGYNFEGSNRYNSLYRSFVTVAWMQLVIAMILWLWAARQMTMQSEEKIMTQTQSIAWKEWRETRIFLWIAFGVFVFLPMIGATEQYFVYGRKHFQYFSSDWVYYFGGVLAIFVAVGSACRDLNDRIEDFWRSRPVSEIRWMLVKYAMGLAIVLIACELPLLTELAVERDKDALTMAVWFPFLLTGIFSVSFAAGALLRRTAHAAMVSLAALLLVYYLPTVLAAAAVD